MHLAGKQRAFSVLVARLILKATELGYEVSLGEAYRPPEMSRFYAAKGTGIANSLHTLKLAIDLNLFKDGKFLTRTEDHRPLGEWWKAQSTENLTLCWGGDWKTDGNHYSILHNGVR